MKSTSVVPEDRPLMAMLNKWNSHKVPGFTSTEGTSINYLCGPYLCFFPYFILIVLFYMLFDLVHLQDISRDLISHTNKNKFGNMT